MFITSWVTLRHACKYWAAFNLKGHTHYERSLICVPPLNWVCIVQLTCDRWQQLQRCIQIFLNDTFGSSNTNVVSALYSLEVIWCSGPGQTDVTTVIEHSMQKPSHSPFFQEFPNFLCHPIDQCTLRRDMVQWQLDWRQLGGDNLACGPATSRSWWIWVQSSSRLVVLSAHLSVSSGSTAVWRRCLFLMPRYQSEE